MAWLGYKKQPLPEAGEAFLVPLGRGISTFCWVVRLHDTRQVYGGAKLGDYLLHDIVIACARWTGRGRPPPTELAGAPALRTAYDFSAQELRPLGPFALVGSSPPPKRWTPLGKVGIPAIDAPLLPGAMLILPDGTQQQQPAHGGFESLQLQAQRAWEMERDPAGVLAAEAAERARIVASSKAEELTEARAEKRRGHASLAELLEVELLPEWGGLVSARSKQSVEKRLRACVSALLVEKGGPEAKLALLARTVEEINTWNERAGVIETPEREGLCRALDDIGHAAGLRGNDLAGPYRDW